MSLKRSYVKKGPTNIPTTLLKKWLWQYDGNMYLPVSSLSLDRGNRIMLETNVIPVHLLLGVGRATAVLTPTTSLFSSREKGDISDSVDKKTRH